MKSRLLIIAFVSLGLTACGSQANTGSHVAQSSSSSAIITDVIVSTPMPNSVVTSPLMVKGKARGNWFFEASLPVVLIDENGNQVGVAPAQAMAEWMTTDFVEFETTFTFQADSERGFLVIRKGNPSGLPENDAEVRMPVRFR